MEWQLPRHLLLLAFLTSLVEPQFAAGQIYSWISPDEAVAGNASCGLSNCPPRILTYGYFHENWRRWPDEGPSGIPSLTPFAVPDRAVPGTSLPDPREEVMQNQRRRDSDASSARSGSTDGDGAGTESGSSNGLRTNPIRPGGGAPAPPLPDESPETPPSTTPLPGPSTGGVDDLLPGTEADDLNSLPMPDESPTGPATPPGDQPSNDDVFNLDDLDQSQMQRMRRYQQARSSRKYRAADVAGSRASTRTRTKKSIAPTSVRPASFDDSALPATLSSRRNPLRTRSAAGRSSTPPPMTRDDAVRQAGWHDGASRGEVMQERLWADEAGDERLEDQGAYTLEANEHHEASMPHDADWQARDAQFEANSAAGVRPVPGRSNPLRRRG